MKTSAFRGISRIKQLSAPVLLSAQLIMGATVLPCHADLLYNYTFDDNTGANTGSGAGGALVIADGQKGGLSFTGGLLDASSNVYRTELEASAYAGSSDAQLSSLGTLSTITITFWMKGHQLTSFARLLNLGSTSDYDGSSALGGIQVALSESKNFLIAINGGNATSLSIGPTLSAHEWYFVAISYDGTSSFGNNSVVQDEATGGDSTRNGQLYVGGINAGVQNFGFSATTSVSPFPSVGPIDFGDGAYLYLAGRYDGTRGFEGLIDNVRIYNDVLTKSQLEELRSATIPTEGKRP